MENTDKEEKSLNLSHEFLLCLIFIFCMMTDRLTVKVIYILDAQNNGKSYFDTIIYKNFENRAKNTKCMEKYVKNKKNYQSFHL